jgi:hypothetical protein
VSRGWDLCTQLKISEKINTLGAVRVPIKTYQTTPISGDFNPAVLSL